MGRRKKIKINFVYGTRNDKLYQNVLNWTMFTWNYFHLYSIKKSNKKALIHNMSYVSLEVIMSATLKHLGNIMLKVSRVMFMTGTSTFNSVRWSSAAILSNWKKIRSSVNSGRSVLICLIDKYVADEINSNRISIYEPRYQYRYWPGILWRWYPMSKHYKYPGGCNLKCHWK